MVRKALEEDLSMVLELYSELFPSEDYSRGCDFSENWRKLIADEKISCLLAFEGARAVSTCSIIIVPNLTRGQRPFALLENMVTLEACRNRGYGRKVIERAVEIAAEQNCYKLMLLSNSQRTAAHGFYERLGFDGKSKKGFEMRFL